MATLPLAAPSDLDIDAAQLERAYGLLDEWTRGDGAEVPSGAIVLGRGGKMVAPRFFGRQAPGARAPIRDDGVFLLASITKPFTYLAALQLVEQGKLNLSDRVTRYLPDFASHEKDDVRVHHLFTHTSGLPDMLPNNRALRAAHAPLSQFVLHVVQDAKLDFQPGTNHQYQSMGTLTVAELVHQISGVMIDEYLREHIFDPLGMQSSSLGSAGVDDERIVSVEIPAEADKTDWHWNSPYWRRFGAPWGGMFSSPSDLAVFCHCLLRYGSYDGKKLWSPATIKMATTNRLDDYPDLAEPIRRTKPWGLGWQLNAVGGGGCFSDLLDREVFGHTGATGTMLWIDRKRDAFCVLLTTAIRSKAPWRLVRLSNMIAAAFA